MRLYKKKFVIYASPQAIFFFFLTKTKFKMKKQANNFYTLFLTFFPVKNKEIIRNDVDRLDTVSYVLEASKLRCNVPHQNDLQEKKFKPLIY